MSSVLEVPAPSVRGLLMILLAAMLWGTAGVATRAVYGLADTNAPSVAFFRLALGTPPLALACWRVLGPKALRPGRRDLARMLAMGALLAQYQACFFAAIREVGVAVATLVTICTAPVLVALLAVPLLGERLALRTLAALVCALVGTALLVGGPGGCS